MKPTSMQASHAQPGILAALPTAARYLTFVAADTTQVRTALQALRAASDGDHCVVGFGESLVRSLGANIPGLKPFPVLAGAGIEIPSTSGSLWCWLRGSDRGALLHETRSLVTTLSPAFELVQAVDAFKHGDGRDLTGYEDGTENPRDEDAVAAAIAAETVRGLNGSSFVAVQQWLHDMRRFDALSRNEQDDSVGRRRLDNEELEDAPESAHVKRTAQESFSPEAFVLRRSMPWSNESQLGLLFVAFGKSFAAFEAQMRRMIGEEDGIADALFKFTRPVTGNYFWCPPLHEGRLDLSALGFR